MLDNIEAFCEIVRQGSFSQAAKRLQISTAMITRRLQYLEKALGTALLHRTTRALSLTEAGRIFHAHAEDILHTYRSSQQNIQRLAEEVGGTVKIGIPQSLNALWLTPKLAAFYQHYPNIKL